MEKVLIKKPYEPHNRVQSVPIGVTRTKKSMQEECDINVIMKKYEKTGLLSHVSTYGGRYEELPGQMDFHDAQNLIIEAREAFQSLPSKIRKRFENDPGKFLEFVQNPENVEEMKKMGLIVSNEDLGPVPVPSSGAPLAPDSLPAPDSPEGEVPKA